MGLRDDLELEANWDRLQQLYPAVTVGVPSLLCLVVAVYILIENGKSATHAKHWEDICLRVAKGRDDKHHECLERHKNTNDNGADTSAHQNRPQRDAVKEDKDSEEDTRIANLTATALMAAVSAGEVSSERVVATFCRRAHFIGHLETRSVTEEFYDEAMAEAAAVDTARKAAAVAEYGGGRRKWDHGAGEENRDVLLGVPVSIKDALHMKGALTTCGMACRAALGTSEEDGLIVKAMRAHGAIPFVRGNVPQCLMLPESENAIWGRSKNPWNLGRTPGGSSGGDGSLVASRSAPIAIGSDVGGSIRIPAHFNGVCGLKPTPERLTLKGMGSLSKNGKRGQRIIRPVAGPLANSVADLELAMTALCSPAMWDGDAALPRLPWDREIARRGVGRPLKVGCFTTDQWFEPCKSITRAVHEAADGLRAAGHEVVPFEPPMSGWDIARLYYGQVGAEGNMKSFVDALQGEKMLKTYGELRRMSGLLNFVRPPLAWVLEKILGDPRRASILRVTRNGGLSTRQYFTLVADTFDLRSKWEEAFSAAELDAVIFPPMALPALPHGASKALTPALTYMFVANLLHWPAGVVPVTLIRSEEADYDIDQLPLNQRDPTSAAAKKAMKGSTGLPVGVQVMTTPFKEELALHVMSEVEKAVNFCAVPEVARL